MMKEYYEQLIGYKVVGFHFERDEHGDDEGWPVFSVVKDGHEPINVVVSRDPEGNGGGFLFLEDGEK